MSGIFSFGRDAIRRGIVVPGDLIYNRTEAESDEAMVMVPSDLWESRISG
jgi:hypothetical protein